MKKAASQKVLESLYRNDMFPREKKPYVIDHARSSGVHLADLDGRLLLDASSQIASQGLGFNAAPYAGTAHFLESWLNRGDTQTFREIRESYRQYLEMQLGWDRADLFLCRSGAEANEAALGHCWENRLQPTRRKILAFRGSFHGRMLAALSATWSPTKREPFEQPGYAALFVEFPALDMGWPQWEPAPAAWLETWENPLAPEFPDRLAAWEGSDDAQVRREVKALLEVRRHLRSQTVFAVLVEPMQGEGGDNYATARFHNGLLCLCRALAVPLICDEVQTGFGLAGEFFWHRLFQFRDGGGRPLFPDYVTCAKKAQAGLVLSHHPIPWAEGFSCASVIRGYIQATAMGQHGEAIREIEAWTRAALERLKHRHRNITALRGQGLCFAFDLPTPEELNALVSARYSQGLHFYPAGDRTARFRLSLAFGKPEIDRLFEKLDALLSAPAGAKTPAPPAPKVRPAPKKNLRDFHALWLGWKARSGRSAVAARKPTAAEILRAFRSGFGQALPTGTRLVLVKAADFSRYRDGVMELQQGYEPSRRSPWEAFQTVMDSPRHIFLAAVQGARLIGIACAGPLRLFPKERGVERDPHWDGDLAGYVMDVTVHPEFRGGGVGTVLKQCVVALGFSQGWEYIKGRNRVGMARRMWWLNQSLGAYIQEYLPGDYPDGILPDDCIYYSIPLTWQPPAPDLGRGMESPLGSAFPRAAFLAKHRGALSNKLSLSNFVTREFAGDLAAVMKMLPPRLRHGYTASGPSECVDKLAKLLWLKRKPRQTMVTFQGCHFGTGSFLARDLSALGSPYFPVHVLPAPAAGNWRAVLAETIRHLEAGPLAVWVEPLMQASMEAMPAAFLVELRNACRRFQVPLVSNDSAGLLYRYHSKYFIPGADPALRPDLGFAHLGGQMSLVYMDKEYWVPEPLALISTWDGDEYSLAAFAEAARLAKGGKMRAIVRAFEKKLTAYLRKQGVTEIRLKNGVGSFQGEYPDNAPIRFARSGNRFLVCPALSDMRLFAGRSADG